MPSYTLTPLFEPQYVASANAALQFAPQGGTVAVPSGVGYQIAVARVANVTAQAVALTVWRIPSGEGIGNQYLVIPQISVPPASAACPALDLTPLWGAVLAPGDAIWAVAGSASALVIQGDGVVIGP